MYIAVRRYPSIGADQATIEQSVQNDLLPILQEQQGFKGYCAFWDQAGAGVSFSIFDKKDHATKSVDAVRSWIMQHQDFFTEKGDEFTGECVAFDIAKGNEQAAGQKQHALYCLIRRMEGLPPLADIADTNKATVEWIKTLPGFRGLYFVRGDREPTSSNQITLFDTQDSARAAHNMFMERMEEKKQNNPMMANIKVTKITEGMSVVMAVGD